jgi:hypothetical protein
MQKRSKLRIFAQKINHKKKIKTNQLILYI